MVRPRPISAGPDSPDQRRRANCAGHNAATMRIFSPRDADSSGALASLRR
jgi:hypothetical protein